MITCVGVLVLVLSKLFSYVGTAIKDVSQILSGKYHGTVLTKVFFYVGLGIALLTVVLISWIGTFCCLK